MRKEQNPINTYYHLLLKLHILQNIYKLNPVLALTLEKQIQLANLSNIIPY